MDYTMKLVYQSNYWYNDGLKRAKIRDLSGAVMSLKKSLQYNRENIAARNLLGLVYYGRGDVIEALVEWIFSKNFQSKDNIANYYIKKIQEVPGELETVNQTVKRYNQSLEYARQNGEDMAIIQLKKVLTERPDYVKAHQLLALLYLHTEQFANARKVLRAVHKLDTTDPVTLRYMHELNEIRRTRAVKTEEFDKKEQQTVTYSIGNETIIQPAAAGYKEHSGIHTFVNLLIGVVVGVAVMLFLVMPAITSSRQQEVNKQTVTFSDQIATQEAQISALKKELEEYRATSEESANAKATAESTQESYEIVMNIYNHYSAESMSNAAMVDELLKVTPDSLGTIGRERYDQMTDSLYPKVCERLYATSKDNFDAANYDTAVTNLEKVLTMDESYDDGGAMLLLAQTYEKKGEQDKANTYYQKLVEEHKDTDAGKSAQKALDAQNDAKKETENGGEQSQDESTEG